MERAKGRLEAAIAMSAVPIPEEVSMTPTAGIIYNYPATAANSGRSGWSVLRLRDDVVADIRH